ncbi:tomoregulin-2-like [Ruditapes philippinarum]|uniref:tomoregulin-2-like n=1 Tax=Ruditapes philippinarum TaxID=129788 RepID=UPI00295AECC6|nr:tomoregulin-2-like [Ruditapes philippinarum]
MEYKLFVLQLIIFMQSNVDGTAIRSDQCKQVAAIDCENSYKPEGNETVCCSDLKVYNNLCYFAQQKCKDPSLTVLYPGHCVQSSPAPGLNNTSTSDNAFNDTKDIVTNVTPDPILVAFCANKDEIVCHDDLDPVCGTDNKFYRNGCEFALARCDDMALGTQSLDVCKTAIHRRMLHFSKSKR